MDRQYTNPSRLTKLLTAAWFLPLFLAALTIDGVGVIEGLMVGNKDGIANAELAARIAGMVALLLAAGLARTMWVLRRELVEREKANDSLSKARQALEAAVEELQASVEQRDQLLRRETTLRRELNHRVRNNIAGLLGLVSIYERSGRDSRQIATAVRGKLLALNEVHDLLTNKPGSSISLEHLIERLAAGAVTSSRAVEVAGPAVFIPPAQANSMAMVLQELFTNSQKHGALSSAHGDIRVRWTIRPADDGAALDLEWNETGVPPPAQHAAPRHGVGLPLIEGLVHAELRGRCEFRFEPASFVFTMHAVLAADDAPGSRVPIGIPEPVALRSSP